jgi:hypothetical protein
VRFMMLMIPNITNDEWASGPSEEAVAAMTAYNEELAKAGALLSLDGLHPTDKGARVTFSKGTPKVTDGPFAEAKEVLGGYWMIQVASLADAVEWARRIPAADGDIVELRQVYEMSDFSPEAQAAAGGIAESLSGHQ